MKQTLLFELPLKQLNEIKLPEKEFPRLTLRNLLSDKFIEENGILCLRVLMKQAKRTQNFQLYRQVIEAETQIKKGQNSLKNIIRDLCLKTTEKL